MVLEEGLHGLRAGRTYLVVGSCPLLEGWGDVCGLA